ncbi:RING finger protein 37-like [Clytia hemisphaerica]|uniref:RING finger protein 37-like n=1 Tax=Clytia hemisphaerica TaxID=252671 RepID=UPI0034D518F3
MKPKETNQICSYGTDLSSYCHNKPLHLVAKYNQKNYENPNFVRKIIFFNEHHSIQQQQQQQHGSIRIPLKPLACISSCSHLAFNITWATIPVISSLEVMGTPSQRNPIFSKTSIDILLASIRSFENDEPLKTEINAKPEPAPNNGDLNKYTYINNLTLEETPSEFIDPITCAMMTIPLLLPSGNNIDQTTYDKFVSTEKTHGRLPSDPFTGLVFHGAQKPIPNTTLKLRIDDFILKTNKKDVPKTYLLGSTVSGKIPTVLSKKPNTPCNSSTDSEPSTKRQKMEPNHQTELKDSLNDALSQTLFTLPSCFERKTEPVIKCLECDKTDKLDLYVLPCKHLLCRKCLQSTTKQSKKCSNCSMFFKHNEVKRFGS